ncbi:hypothetical protein H3H37_12235 [Duganella sp. LX20W]|uniref:Uncharacterized protein n=1 Tax=Rugamonas brunnea TaxID=2758569 RepID=A0A7W2ESH3_9BURK|nr:protealysin inhibitor emfourin [Rugamonas brunnea]MBA5637822.1 hypothetical protein [Rugamonas brunnea]
MRLVLKSTGGFTGPAGAQTRTADTAALSAGEGAHLRQLVHDSDFFALPASLQSPAPQSWDFLYTLTAQADDGQRHTVSYHLDAAPPALRELTAALDARAPD